MEKVFAKELNKKVSPTLSAGLIVFSFFCPYRDFVDFYLVVSLVRGAYVDISSVTGVRNGGRH